jgi:serine/threonine-protein kinase
MAEPHPSHDLYAAGVVALVALNGPIKLHDGSFRPDELTQLLRGVTPKLSAVIRGLVAAQPENRYQDADTVRRDLPRVPAGYPLTHADGAPLDLQDTLDPLPPNAPGAARPERPAPQVAPASMEAIRSGQVQQGFSVGSASPQTGPQWANGPGGPGRTGPGGPGRTGPGGPGHSGPRTGHATTPHTAAGTTTTTGQTGGQDAQRRRSTMIAIGLGAGTALVLGMIVAIVLLMVFDGSSFALLGGTGTSGIDAAFAEVEAGQECADSDEGVIALTPEGAYVACTATDEGHVFL